MRKTSSAITFLLWFASILGLSLPNKDLFADKFYKYKLDGKVWVGNYCPRRAKHCTVIMKTPDTKPRREKKSNKTGYTKSNRKWKPPSAISVGMSKRPSAKKIKSKEQIQEIIEEAARIYHIPVDFIRAVIQVESSYQIYALSYKGAMGLMQLMPSTAASLGVTDPYDPYQNIMGGTKLLRMLANKFNGDMVKVLSGYHAGRGAVEKKGGIPYIGTDGYVRKVLDHYYRLKHSRERM